ncbi:MAG: polysaccharide deacetylase family protein [Bacteroidia bacterium]|jgi:hypothetical protein|nr:polysaccharide deacetylase family protein [Bacteroidia bacterium]
MKQALIFTDKLSIRLEYIVQEIFERRMGLSCAITNQANEFESFSGVKFNYSANPFLNAIQIPVSSLLFEEHIRDNFKPKLEIHKDWEALLLFDEVNTSDEIPFDVLAASFYCLSRYEEYQPFISDQHGRFTSSQSVIHAHPFLFQIPLIEHWCERMVSLILSKGYEVGSTPATYSFIPTIDIDFVFRYHGLSWVKWIAKWLKNIIKGELAEAIIQIKSRFDATKDPYHVFNTLVDLHPHLFFLLVRGNTNFDKNVSMNNKSVRALVAWINTAQHLGIHPSYYTMTSRQQMEKELEIIHQMVPNKIYKSRQHFLRVKFPDTFEQLSALSIREDYSLGYAEQPGFRASTCKPFTFFNLKKNQASELILHSTVVMDVTLKDYLKLNPDDALKECMKLSLNTKRYKGNFITLWHNNSLSNKFEWKNWLVMYENLIEFGRSK